MSLRLGGDIADVIVKGNELFFYDTSSQMMTTLNEKTLKLSKAGVLKEFPDLKKDVEWKTKAIERLKEHMKKMNTEMDKINYVKNELVKFGYEPLYWQRAGFRPQKWRKT